MKNSLRICYVYQDQYPWEVRVKKITEALAERGAEVHIVSRNKDCLPELEASVQRITIHRLSGSGNSIIRILKNFPAFFSPFWIKKIVDVVRQNKIDLIIIRDLPLSPAAYIAGKITGKPVIMDMAENYPALIRSTWDYRGPSFVDLFIRNPYFLRLMEKFVVPRLDGVLVVSKQSAERVEKLSPGDDQIWVVGNTPILNEENGQTIYSELADKISSKSSFILLYTGMIEAHRGIDVPVRALAKLSISIPGIKLVIVGEGTYESKLKNIIKEMNLEDSVFFTGWVPNKYLNSIIKISDIGLIPHYVSEHIDTTLPNKIYDYMAEAKPVLVTQSRSLSAIIQAEKCGLIYNDHSPDDLVEKVLKLYDEGTRKRLGENGKQAVLKRLNWETDKKHLWEAINSVLDSKKLS
ncbi:MAG: glycosyltransferase family 4 protein [Calditrichaceae bacterium]